MAAEKPIYDCPHCHFAFDQFSIESVMRTGKCPNCERVTGSSPAEAKKTAAAIHFQILTVLVRNFYLFGPIGCAFVFILTGFIMLSPFMRTRGSVLEYIVLIIPAALGVWLGHLVAKRIVRAWAMRQNIQLRQKYTIPLLTYREYIDLY
jgi:hypothetical protein